MADRRKCHIYRLGICSRHDSSRGEGNWLSCASLGLPRILELGAGALPMQLFEMFDLKKYGYGAIVSTKCFCSFSELMPLTFGVSVAKHMELILKSQ